MASMLTQHLITYLLSSEYKHRADYFTVQSMLAKYIWPVCSPQTIHQQVPTLAPSICLNCMHILEPSVQYGKLWHNGCPACKHQPVAEWSELRKTLCDVRALLAPILTAWEIDSLLATALQQKTNIGDYYAMHI